MPNILVDTCVFLRLEGIYSRTLNCILVVADVIAITQKIMNEYKGRAISPLILQAFLTKLQNMGKLRFFKSSYVSSAIRRYRNMRRSINYPTHNRDKKWINTAIATKATHVITTDNHLLGLAPNRCNDDIIEIVEPSQYTEIRCPENN